MPKLRIRLNSYPDLIRNDNLYNALINKISKDGDLARLMAKTKNKKKHIRLVQKEIQKYVLAIKKQLAPRLQFYFKSKQITVSALERGMLGDKHNNGKAEGFHIEVLDLLIIYITGNINSNFCEWIGSEDPKEVSRYRTAYHVENKMSLSSLEQLYAIYHRPNPTEVRQKSMMNNLRKEITIPIEKPARCNGIDVKEQIYTELVKDNFQEAINILGNLIKQKIPDLYIAIIIITSDLNDLNRREIIGQISQNDFRIAINMVKERIYKLVEKVTK